MFEPVALGLQQLSDPTIWLVLVAGSVLGIVLGAIPGIGPGVGIVLLLPVTYTMDPLAGITLSVSTPVVHRWPRVVHESIRRRPQPRQKRLRKQLSTPVLR